MAPVFNLNEHEYNNIVNSLKPVLYNLPYKLIAIDGRDGTGKTTLGRFLACYFNVSLIETDLFLTESSTITHEYDWIKKIINVRFNKQRPVIIEGIKALDILKRINCHHDYLIYVTNKQYDGSKFFSEMFNDYEEEYNPKNNANYVLALNH
jgi:uridine kinase